MFGLVTTQKQAVGQIWFVGWSLLTADLGIFCPLPPPQPGYITCPSSRLPVTALATGHHIHSSLPREPGAFEGGTGPHYQQTLRPSPQ